MPAQGSEAPLAVQDLIVVCPTSLPQWFDWRSSIGRYFDQEEQSNQAGAHPGRSVSVIFIESGISAINYSTGETTLFSQNL